MIELKEIDRNKFIENRFLFPIRGEACLSLCKKLNDRTRIGSAACRKCEHLMAYDAEEKSIVCMEIRAAVGESSPAFK